jgi:ubiquinone/menaquinone biosynthesis C-methylase UbiE
MITESLITGADSPGGVTQPQGHPLITGHPLPMAIGVCWQRTSDGAGRLSYGGWMAGPSSADPSYDAIADWYDDWLGTGATAEGDPYFAPLFELLPPVAGQRICDLACGQGRVSRTLALHGATVVGIDASAQLLSIAARYGTAGDSIEFRRDNAHSLAGCADAEFDGVFCNMAMMDIRDLGAAMASSWRVLRPGGWFAFSVLHPCFNAPRSAAYVDDVGHSHRTVTDYFTEGFWQSAERVGPIGRVGAYHRTLATYLNTLIATGFSLRHTREIAGPSAGWQQVPPVIAFVADRPQS